MEKLKGWKKKTLLGLGVLVLALLFCVGLNEKGDVKAAEQDVISIGSDEGKDEYNLKVSEIKVSYVPSVGMGTSNYTWDSDDKTVVDFKDEKSSSDAAGAILVAKGVGETTVYVMKDGVVAASRKIVIRSAIVQNSALFENVPEISEEAIMVLELGKDYSANKLGLLFDATNATWSSGSKEVATVNSNGIVTPKGTGVTTISVSYNVGENLKTSSVQVYVGPSVSVNANSISTGSAIWIDTEKYVYPGINCDNKEQKITDKIEWVITDEKGKTLSSSSDTNLDILTYNGGGYNPYWVVDANAGTYYLTVATKGCINADNAKLKKTYTINVYATAPTDKTVTHSLQVGDSYDIAAAFNIAPEDFSKYFGVASHPDNAGIYYTYDGNKGVVTAVGKTNSVEFTIKINSGYSAYFKVDSEVTYTVKLTIYQGFTLNHSAVRLPLKSTLALTTIYGESRGVIKWTSSDPSTVSVDESGNIQALKVTGDNSVTITATMTMEDGRVLKATCTVAVDNTATGITLSKEELELEVEQVVTVKANLAPNTVTSADLQWLVSDESIIQVDVQPNMLSATITGLKAGTAVITVVNKDNYVAGYCMVTVKSPITKITIEKEVEVYQYYKKYKLEATYEPGDATSVALEWSSKDPSIATVDSDGLVTLVGGGTTIITVRPAYNPNGIFAQCTLTVIEEATDFNIKEASVTVEVGETVTLTGEIKSDTAVTTITWESMDKSVATVTDKGVVKGVKAGQTYIVARTSEGHVDYCLVTVTQKASGVTLDVYTVTVAVGESYTVTATPNPATATETTFTWSSKDKSIATVDNNGKITGVAAGSTVILVKTSTGSLEYVYVTVYSQVTGMSLNYDNVTLVKGDTFKLKAVFTPSDVTNKNVTWKSSNDKIVTVDKNGKLKGIKGGAAIISATSEDGGYTAICLVSVQEKVTSLKLNKTSYTIGVGKTATLKATVTSNSSSNPKLKWTTSNSKILSVSQKGKIKGKKVGTATITVKVTDGTGLKATCKVKVVKAATKVSLNKRVLTVVVGQTEKLKATITPSNATIKSVKWTSDDAAIAEVQNGEVLGLSVGSTKITATAKDNSGKKATCYVNVIEEVPATSIVLSAQNLTLTKGQSQKIGYSVVPSNNTDKVYFDSDNRAVATVNGSGKVYAKRAGVANITITTSSGKQIVVKVTVIGLNKTKITMEQYDTETLFVDGVSSGISWFTTNPNIATVSGGKITARKAGTCTVYAKVNGVDLSCTVVVKQIK